MQMMNVKFGENKEMCQILQRMKYEKKRLTIVPTTVYFCSIFYNSVTKNLSSQKHCSSLVPIATEDKR